MGGVKGRSGWSQWAVGHIVTFALQALAEEALQQPLAVLADGWPGVGVHREGVWHLDTAQDHLLHPDGPAAQQ